MIDWPIVLQTLLIIAAVFASFVRLRERITALETTAKHLENDVKPIPGISRAIARLEGVVDAEANH